MSEKWQAWRNKKLQMEGSSGFHLKMVLASIAMGQKHHSFSGLGTA